jgi:hypothetical protein
MDQPRIAPTLIAAARELWQIFCDICDPYRPELHYMRGPGPKWHAVHAPVANQGPFSGATNARG